jgi:DNA-directed RNA polymerase subunit H (RpoH/RPB5)
MDLTFLQRLGTALKNAHNMIKCRGLQMHSGIAWRPDADPLEIAGLVYQAAMATKSSLGLAARSSWRASHGRDVGLWLIDRNFDTGKNRERMTSTDQVKAIQESIREAPEASHIVLVPMKLSPQAKKESLHAEVFLFDDLLINLSAHEWVLPHKRVSIEQARAVLGSTLNPDDLPVLPRSDPVAKWWAFPEGSIVRIDNPTMISYRIVKNV